MTPADLALAVPGELFERTAPGIYLLPMPLVVGHDATLHIDRSTLDFRMSEEHGALLVNDGRLFVTGSGITAWREREGAPALFRDGQRFRPCPVAWGGTETYIEPAAGAGRET